MFLVSSETQNIKRGLCEVHQKIFNMTVLHHSGLHTLQSLGQLDSQEVFAVELSGELEGGTCAVLSSQEQEVALS